MSEIRYTTIIPIAGAAVLGRNCQHFSKTLANPLPFQVLLIAMMLLAFLGRASTYISRDRYDAELVVNNAVMKPEDDRSFKALGERLEELGLNNGYAQFWNASPITVLSKNNVSIRHVEFSQNGTARRDWFCKKTWYDDEAHFVVVNTSEIVFGNNKLKPDSVEAVIKTFGKPDNVYECNEFLIYQYDEDISKQLRK